MRGTSIITITADPKQLGPGTYDGNINLSGNGTSVSVPVTFAVTQPARLTITTTQNDLPAGNLTSSYSFFLLASGGVPPYSWSVISGALPDGLRLNSATGEISGTPKVVGAIKALSVYRPVKGQPWRDCNRDLLAERFRHADADGHFPTHLYVHRWSGVRTTNASYHGQHNRSDNVCTIPSYVCERKRMAYFRLDEFTFRLHAGGERLCSWCGQLLRHTAGLLCGTGLQPITGTRQSAF